ncbi:basic amino acid ABC transporter substrate-binding protein [Anthocerotibacter panamensis]|uniref:basic amino acid ABC transporter substrate-binding protein n=1 Tax=Anthocerotibacter panamensis TaxID=2857077 RepID=UPI001C405901|nr:basic amino acid ABC transporter substrate-binding protein [Anthocerotibacter panamensis]
MSVVGFTQRWVLCCLLLTACATNPSGSDGKTLIVATDPTFPPFESQAPGGVVGFDMDLMRAVAAEAGLSVTFKSLPFDGILGALQAGTADAAISTITITPERAKVVSFTRPYYKSGLAITVREADKTIHSTDDLANKTIAVNIGTVGAMRATTIPGAKVLTFDSGPQQFQELINGRADAVLNDAMITEFALRTGAVKGVRITGQWLTEEYWGIAVAPRSPKLAVLDQALATVISKGIYAKLYRRWFSREPLPLPTTAPALAP